MLDSSTPARRAAALAVHFFTATGAATAFMAFEAAVARDFATMFAWLGLALFIDGIDGALARAARVKIHAAWVNGDVLDLVIDFLTYVFVPIVALWRSGLLGDDGLQWLCPVVVAASAIYFADVRMKTADNWFRGFPALWNVAVFYLVVFAPGPALAAAIVVVLTALMFAPIAFVHPMRVEKARAATIVVTMLWCACAAALIAGDFGPNLAARAGVAVAGAWFVGLTAWRAIGALNR